MLHQPPIYFKILNEDISVASSTSATRTNSSGTEALKTNRTNSSGTETLETNRTKSSGTETLEVQSILTFLNLYLVPKAK